MGFYDGLGPGAPECRHTALPAAPGPRRKTEAGSREDRAVRSGPAGESAASLERSANCFCRETSSERLTDSSTAVTRVRPPGRVV